ncbi:integrase arm-type DNA-binding domain-containing protein [Methylomonas sp. OY6]|uniref:Integrase arm-type DNA-binding domain-containing protein n=1 Tax=Methylomonas defluvii TaxID=3045149 RepID=A0ABU4UFP4_9GAMM|nr:integrase arm-type DNA-binding domain-containing protein [Methylomonas sp. OY6]MDX8127737.1 integrase arm-type DNA-binding domain-containing protein [Methylomonas sp. OY6]
MLTDTEIRKAKPTEKPQKISDGGGLFLLVTPHGSKLWRLAYRFAGKQKTLAIGEYPSVGLADARTKREEAKKQLANGIDPSTAKKAAKAASQDAAANSFEVIAREWHETHMANKTEDHAQKTLTNFEKDVFPWLGRMPITNIEAPDVLAVVKRIEQRGANEIAKKAKRSIGQVFRYAIATGRAVRNPVPDLQGAFVPTAVKHHAAITDPVQIGALLRACEDYTGHFATRCALRLSFLVMLRPGEVRKAEWSEIDLERAEWRIPAAKMKMREEHIIPLSRQALTIFEEIKPLTSNSRFVFPSVRSNARPMSENTITGALRRLGYTGAEMTAHGFRGMASTRLNEAHLFHPDAIERQLAHGEQNSVRAAYNRAQYLPERVKMLQWWADYLDSLKEGAAVVPFQRKSA